MTLWQDLTYAFRTLLKKRAFTFVAMLSLAVGIGANAVIFSLVNTTLLRPLPYRDPGRLVMVWSQPLDRPGQYTTVNVSSYLALRERSQSFEALGSYFWFGQVIGREENGAPAERITGQYFSPSMFDVLGVKPALGRSFTEEEGKPIDFAHVVIISDSYWERRFKRDPNIIGRQFQMDGESTTIIGVMPPGFYLEERVTADFWGPGGFTRQRYESGGPLIRVVGRLKPGVTIEQAQAEMSALTAQLAASDPARNKGMGALVQPLHEAMVGGLRPSLLTLQGSVAFVLLIACANVAGLLLARANSRRTEFAVRSAIGASRRRVIRQLLTESAVLAGLGGLVGIFLAVGGLQLFIGTAPPDFPNLKDLSLDTEVLAFTAGISLLTGLLFGIVPAVQSSRANLVDALKDNSRSTTSGSARQRFRSILVTFQIALALMLLVGAGLMINSFVRLQNNQLGIDPNNLLTFDFRIPVLEVMKPVGRYRGNGLWEINPSVTGSFQQIFQRLGRVPGAVSVAGSSASPAQGANNKEFFLEGQSPRQPNDASGPRQTARYIGITPNYFATLRIPLLRGRDFNDRDTDAATRVIIISKAFADQYWPNQDPLGKRITIDFLPDDQPREVIGVVADTRIFRRQTTIEPIMYVPYTQEGPRWVGPALGERAGMIFVMRTEGDPFSLVPAARSAVAEVDPNRPIAGIQTVEQALEGQINYQRLYVLMLGVFGGAATLLAAIGIYGVMAFNVAQRRHEIGVRMALGASGKDVLRMVLRQAILMIGIGLALGIAGSLGLTRLLATALWEVKPTDPATFIAVSLFLAAIALAACFIPTRQAARVDPTVALRNE